MAILGDTRLPLKRYSYCGLVMLATLPNTKHITHPTNCTPTASSNRTQCGSLLPAVAVLAQALALSSALHHALHNGLYDDNFYVHTAGF